MPIPEFPLSVPNHAGQPNDPADVFFGELDELGPVKSAQTSLNRSRGPRRWTKARVAAAIFGLFLGAIVGLVVAAFIEDARKPADGDFLWWVVVAGALAGLLLIAWLGRPWDTCTVVAKRGLAIVKRRGERSKQRLLLFEQAVQLRTQQVNMYYNGIYLGTNYTFDWLDGQGKRLFRINGSYRQRRKKPLPPNDPYFFALAAENAWCEHRRPAIEAALARHAAVRFPYGKSGYIELAPDCLEIATGKKPERLMLADIEKIALSPGLLVIKPRRGGWFSQIRLQTSRIGDLKLLLELLQKASLLQA